MKLLRCISIAITLNVFYLSGVLCGEDTHFYFVQITDTHFGNPQHYELALKTAEKINNLPMKIEFVAHTGDIFSDNIDNGEVLKKSMEVLSRIKPPVHYVAGNHDIRRTKADSTLKAYLDNFKDLIFYKDYKGVRFIFVYTEPLATDIEIKKYKPLKELKAILKKDKNIPKIIFHHTPSVEDFYNNEFHEGWKKKLRDEWIKTINSCNVKAVMAGHFHRDEHHWLGDVPLYVCPAVSTHWGRQTTFRIYEYNNGKISYRTQYIRQQ
ncbi:MAG: metallophosphoesterase [Endomicrobiales bacterium]|nr:metallophosphoesterase [Endomicrobiales bacterium]